MDQVEVVEERKRSERFGNQLHEQGRPLPAYGQNDVAAAHELEREPRTARFRRDVELVDFDEVG